MKTIVLLAVIHLSWAASSQIINTATMDTTDYQVKGRFTVEGYLDVYYAYNFNKPESKDQPYLVSMARHNEVNINLAFVDLKYSSSRVRARIAPGFGTYIDSNYAGETGTLKNFIEANAGYRIVKEKNVWVDIGVLGSPYTNESAISKDHLAYTRSLAAENVPYYLSGLKLTLPISKKINSYFYLLNGWQQINDLNEGKSLGTQLEIRPTDNLLINWNTYVGSERSAIDSMQGTRVFTDIFMIYNHKRWSFTGCLYGGSQESEGTDRSWWQANMVGRYAFNGLISLTGRLEYFRDDDGVVVVPVTPVSRFKTYGSSIGVNVSPDSNLLFRTEVRYLFSDTDVYLRGAFPVSNSLTITGSACVWF